MEDAHRGLVVPIDEAVVADDGTVVWDNSRADGLAASGIELSGDGSVLTRLAGVLDPGDKNFAIVTP